MPDVNLLKDTKGLESVPPKPPAGPGSLELSHPDRDQGPGIGGALRSMFSRRPRTLPMTPPKPPVAGHDMMSLNKGITGERILSEVKRSGPAMIPIPEDDDSGYNINLLSEELTTTVDPRRRLILLGLIVVGSVILVGLVFTGLVVYQQNIKKQITTKQDQLNAVRAEIKSLSSVQQVAVTTVQKIGAIRTLIDRHTRWTKFFRQLETYTLPTVTYGPSFSADISGNITLSATTNSYEEVARQYLIFQQLVKRQTFISAFSITGASNRKEADGQSQVSFAVSMTLLPSNFTMTAEEFEHYLSTTSPVTTP